MQFVESPMRRRFVVCALSLACFALAFVFSGAVSSRAEAVGNFILAPGRIDSVYDVKRDIVYVSQQQQVWDEALQQWVLDSGVVRYHVGTGSYLPRIEIQGNLLGLDISPDCDTLLVCDDAHSQSHVWLHRVDLETLLVTKVSFDRQYMEDGTFAVAFGQDGSAFFTTGFEGSGWTPMRRYNPTTGTSSVAMPSVRQHTMVSASGDGATIALVESNISSGPVRKIDVASGAVTTLPGTGWFNYEVATSRNASQTAVPTYNGTYIYDGTVQRSTRVGNYGGSQPIGLAYHPFEDIVYFAWADWQNPNARYVKAHRTSDFALLGDWDFENVFNHPGNGAFNEGRLRVARDGSYLFSTVDNGVRYVSLGSHRPVANGTHTVTLEDTPIDVTLTGVATNGITGVEITGQPAKGILSGAGPTFTYSPNANFNGQDSFTFRVTDGVQFSPEATVRISVTSVNDPPTFVKGPDQSVLPSSGAKTVTNWATSITAGPADEAGQAIRISTVTSDNTLFAVLPAIASNGTLTFTPAAKSGTATVTITITDNGGTVNGGQNSIVRTFTITVRPPNRAPVAVNDAVSVDEDGAVDIPVTLNDSDADNDPLSFWAISKPPHGRALLSNLGILYIPDANYHGPDSFTYQITDGYALSNVATVNVTVNPVNDAPTAESQSVTTDEDTAVNVILKGGDIDGGPLTYQVVSGPSHGELTGTAPNLTYIPSPNYSGSDSFTFRTSDGQANSANATVSITVKPVNDPPQVGDQTQSTREDVQLGLELTAFDPDGDTLTWEIVTLPAHGELTGSAPSVTYTPAANYHGSDSLLYRVTDGVAQSSVATVSITVSSENDIPFAHSQNVRTAEDTSLPIELTGADVENDPLAFELVSPPSHGTLSGAVPNVLYQPDPNYSGPDFFSFRVFDGTDYSPWGAINIQVTPVNDGPAANSQSVTTAEDISKSITLSGSDPEGDSLTYAVIGEPSNGTLSGSAPNLTYTPAANYSGSDSFTFRVSDGTTQSAPATVSITVTAVNDAPTANGQAVTTAEDTVKAITLVGSDPDGQALTYQIVTGPTRGTLTGTAPNLTYRPSLNYSGADSFTFRVSDGTAQSAPATVSINVTPVNDPPIAVNDTASTKKNTAVDVNVRANDSDPEGGALTVASVTTPSSGTAAILANGNVRFTPKKGSSGTVTFSYTVRDPSGATATAQVTVTVR